MIDVGDNVVCVLPPGADPNNLPVQKPEVGEVYTVTGVYPAIYGLGCQLEGLDPRPYHGYIMHAEPTNPLGAPPGWYFRKLQPIAEMLGRVREVEPA